MSILGSLSPARVWHYFEELCAIPHGSGNTARISAYCEQYAKAHGFSYVRDSVGNVIIRKPASAGYEDHPTVILQGHLDMVAEKDADYAIDMENDGLRIGEKDGWVYAEHTTLGGDDGVAVAMTLAILEDDTLPHPPLEALFTIDEETGMDGAVALDPSLLKGKLLINADSEEEGVLTVGCAGGARVVLTVPFETEKNTYPCYRVSVGGLIGGHSGAEIDKGRLNANVLLGRFLDGLCGDNRLVSIGGGSKDNAIPRSAEAIIACPFDLNEAAKEFVAKNVAPTDPDLFVKVEAVSPACETMTKDDTRRVTGLICALPNGIQAMSREIDGLVQTSLNMGVVTTEENVVRATFSVRSSVNAEKTALIATLKETAERFGAAFDEHGHYPAWEYRAVSPLRDVMKDTYRRLYGKEPEIEVIHAGLECGLFSDKIAGLDAVSLGPDMRDIHTTRERLSVESTARVYHYICEVLKAL